MKINPLPGRVYQAIPGFEDHLKTELPLNGWRPLADGSPLFFAETLGAENTATPVFWYQNCWLEPFRVEFDSINEAASALRDIQRNWAPCLHTQFRRGSLIASKLPSLSVKPRPFPWLLPDAPMGAWTLLDPHTMIAGARCSSPFPGGLIEFEEDKLGPPSRAYLKLWEALVRLRRWPAPGERCLDAGASPGGWTWALARLGAQVIAVDRAPLEDRIAAMSGVEYIRHDAFTLKPEDTGPIDWLFCDVICYPSRLYEWIEKWLASGLCKNFVCTIKMQGNIEGNGVDFETPRRFAAIPGGAVVHLCHNKHELTWMKVG
ncbi:SAM-dependent methyltransferase [Spirochaetia bacterium]|nr:SAM-dependent methyltransferase [Spirochaetia bacterium]